MFVLLYSLHLNLDFEMKIFGFAIANGFVIFLDSQSKLFCGVEHVQTEATYFNYMALCNFHVH